METPLKGFNMQNNKSSSKKRRAFTLFEILIVIGLMALLVSFVVGNLDRIMTGGQESVVRSFVKASINTPMMAYKIDVGRYPSTEEGIAALAKAPDNVADRWRGPYIKEMPKDPWGNPYQYVCPGTHNKDSYDIWSLGPDGRASEDDIGNW